MAGLSRPLVLDAQPTMRPASFRWPDGRVRDSYLIVPGGLLHDLLETSHGYPDHAARGLGRMTELQRDRIGQVVDDVSDLAGGEITHRRDQGGNGLGTARVNLVERDAFDHAKGDVPVCAEPAAT